MIPPKRRTRHADFLHVALALNARHKFFAQEPVVEYVIPDAGAGVQVFGVPAIAVDAADAVQFHLARFDEPAGGVNQLKIFVFVIMPHRRGEQHDWVAPVAVHQHFHVAAQVVRIPSAIIFLQGGVSFENFKNLA